MNVPIRSSLFERQESLMIAEACDVAHVRDRYRRLRERIRDIMKEVQATDQIIEQAKAQRDASQQLSDKLQCELNELRASMERMRLESSPAHPE